MARRRVRLFLYGTLQPQADTPMGDWVARRMVQDKAACVSGAIHAVCDRGGWYPALVPARGAQWVVGTLCDLSLRAGELAMLDRYEGDEYRRARIAAYDARGRAGRAMVYMWRAPMPHGAERIAGGNFLEWLKIARRTALNSAPRRR